MPPRIERGRPRGGLGYAGLVLAAGALIGAGKLPPVPAMATALAVLPFCVWFAWGLRADDADDEATDVLVLQGHRRFLESVLYDDDRRQDVYRFSTVMVLATLGALAWSAARAAGY